MPLNDAGATPTMVYGASADPQRPADDIGRRSQFARPVAARHITRAAHRHIVGWENVGRGGADAKTWK